MPRGTLTRLEEARELTEYNRTLFERYARRLRRLPWKEADGNVELGHLTPFRTLVHILNVQEVWLVYIVRGRTNELSDLFEQENRHPVDWQGFRAYSTRVWSGIDETHRTLNERDFVRRVRAPWMPGRYTVRDAFFQATIEQAHHIGEIIGAMWQRDRAMPAMTWMEILRQGPPRHRSRAARR